MTYLGWEEGVAGKEAPPPPSSRPRGLPVGRSGSGEVEERRWEALLRRRWEALFLPHDFLPHKFSVHIIYEVSC